MSGTISSSTTGPVVLTSADNPLTITSTGTVTSTGSGVVGIYGSSGTTWSITNAGTVTSAGGDGISLASAGIIGNTGAISDLGTIGYGVVLGGGGTVTNTASILGAEDGVKFAGALGTLVNSGTITATVDDGVGLFAGGTVANAVGGSISAASTKGAGIYITGGAGTVTNSGSITATANIPAQGTYGIAIDLAAGGTVTNGSKNNPIGSLSGVGSGVLVAGAAGTVANYGTISATGANGAAVYFESGGSVTNASTGTISGSKFGVFLEGGFSTLTNQGSISGGTDAGVVLGLGGVVTNAAGASISGASVGVYVKYRATGTVTNSGNISASAAGGAGIDLADGGSVTNYSAGSISGTNFGVFVPGTFTVANTGTVANPGTVVNDGHITSTKYGAVDLGAGGTVTNNASASIVGGSNGVYFGTIGMAGTVTNSGSISATTGTSSAGVAFGHGGSVTNTSSGSISGIGSGVFATNVAGTVTNSGLITGAHGVALEAGGTVTNNTGATIAGQVAGVFSQGGVATLVNAGSISATGGAGADIEAGGSVTNLAGGSVSGSTFGVFITGGSGTVTNAGTISGASGTAVSFAGGGNRVVVDPGAVFSGLVYGGTGGDTLELAAGTGSGTFPGLGTEFIGFTTVAVDAGASWQFTGALSDPGTTLVNAGTISTTVAFAGGGNRVVVDPGAVFSGVVNGGDTLALAAGSGSGVFSGLGTQFTGFTSVTVDAGASWQLTGANTIAAGTVLTDAGTLVNAGTLTDAGTFLVSNALTNTGNIAATGAFSDSGALTNSGAITGAVTLTAGGSLTNLASGIVNGPARGASTETLVNAGRIGAGGTAVAFTGGGNHIVVDPGAVFSGTVDGGSGGDTLELAAGSGSLSGLGTQFTGFTTVAVDAGAFWQLAGANTIATGTALTGAGTLVNTGALVNAGNIAATGAFSNSGALTNSGAITGAVTLTAGGSLVNLASGVVNGPVRGASTETLVNADRIGAGGTAVAFTGGGNRVVVDPGATFSGVVNGGSGNDTLELAAGSGSVSGLGTQFTGFTTVAVDAGASWQLAGANTIAAGTALTGAGALVNTGALVNAGNIAATGAFSDSGALTNSGAITGAVTLTAGGSLANLASGIINGPVLGASSETLTNAGRIGAGGTAVAFTGGGNHIVVDPGAVFSGTVNGGTANDTLELVAGSGSLSGLGTQFTGFTTVAVDAGASWQLAGANTIAAGTVLTDAGALVNTGALVNAGNIAATGAFSDSGALTNSGAITGAVTLTSSGSLVNLASGIINGPVLGASSETLTNAGRIGAGGTAVAFTGGGNRVVVDPGAVFSGAVDGGSGGDTLELTAGSGSLSGLGTQFTGFTTVAVDAGASWQLSDGGDAAPSFINDGTVVVGAAGLVLGAVSEDSGASGVIDIGGGAAEFAGSVTAGQTLAFTAASGLVKLDQPGGFAGAIQNFQAGDALDLSAVIANGASYSNGMLSLTDNGTMVDPLALSTPYQASAQNPGGNPVFTLTADGNGGTLVTVGGKDNVITGTYTNGIVLGNPATQNPLTVTATGYVANTGNAIYGEANAAWTIENLGTISGNGNAGVGISLAAGGTVTNGQSGATGALISGYYNGIAVASTPGIVTNYGSIQAGTGIGVYLAAGGTVTNLGTIGATPGYYGVFLAGRGTVVNGATGNRGALIDGSYTGIVFGKPHGIVFNYGTIEGGSGTSVYFTGGHNRVVDEPGARFVGAVSAAGTAYNTLDLAKGSHSGAIGNLYHQFSGFTTNVKVDAGATWKLANSGPGTFNFTNDGTIAANGSLLDFGVVAADPHKHGRIDVGNNTVEFSAKVGVHETVDFDGNAGTVQMDDPQAFHGTIAGFGAGDVILFGQQQLGQLGYAGGKLTVTAEDGSTVANFAVSGNHSPSDFQLTPDHHGIMFSNSA